MERYYTEPINTSSDSIIIKNDSNLDSSFNHTGENEDNYDLEIQKPSERAKIIKDKDFFKKLSYSFYADSTQNHKSVQMLPKCSDSSGQDNSPSSKHTMTPANKSDVLRIRIMNRLSAPDPDENQYQQRNLQQEEPKSFKIKTLHNFYLPQAVSNPKMRAANSPISRKSGLPH